MHKNKNTQNSHSFLALAFFRGICLRRHQRIWDQHKVLRFLIPVLIFFTEKNFWVIIALFACFKCKCEKNYTFSYILQKVKSYFFANIYSIILRLIPIKFETLKPPSVYPPPLVRREDTLAGWRGGGGQYFGRRQTLHVCKYFVPPTNSVLI